MLDVDHVKTCVYLLSIDLVRERLLLQDLHRFTHKITFKKITFLANACQTPRRLKIAIPRNLFMNFIFVEMDNEEFRSRTTIDSSDSDGGAVACPRKRRRQCAVDDTTTVATFGTPLSSIPPTMASAFSDNDSVHSSISRSSSLIQFESLEKHCQVSFTF